MEITSPTWNQKDTSYTLTFYGQVPVLNSPTPVFLQADSENIDLSSATLPVIPAEYLEKFLTDFIEKAGRWFQSPLRIDTLKKRLRHAILTKNSLTTESKDDWYTLDWQPASLVISNREFTLYWKVSNITPAQPQISVDFLGSATPRAHSPEPTQASEGEDGLRTIQIQSTLDTLVPIGDLPLSDLPPLAYYKEEEVDEGKEEVKRRIREARLRVALAKLKAQRMEERYYSKYGEAAENSESSDLTTDSDSDEHLSRDH
jgi:hypothetical protein